MQMLAWFQNRELHLIQCICEARLQYVGMYLRSHAEHADPPDHPHVLRLKNAQITYNLLRNIVSVVLEKKN
jgi:hypothetical protein